MYDEAEESDHEGEHGELEEEEEEEGEGGVFDADAELARLNKARPNDYQEIDGVLVVRFSSCFFHLRLLSDAMTSCMMRMSFIGVRMFACGTRGID